MNYTIEAGSYMDNARRALPEEKLLAAMILRAYHDLFDRNIDIRRDAVIWFEGLPQHRGDGGLSYKEVCEALGLNDKLLWDNMQNQLKTGLSAEVLEYGSLEDLIRRTPPDKSAFVDYGRFRCGSETRSILR